VGDMVSVKQRADQVSQPRGGYVNPRTLRVQYPNGTGPESLDHHSENVSPILVGLAVDYLTRVATGGYPPDTFRVSLRGARRIGPDALSRAEADVSGMTAGQVDAGTIAAALRLSSFDVAVRNDPALYRPDAQTTPDAMTTRRIGMMVDRSVSFVASQGGITLAGFTFLGGYTDTVDSGDADFATPGVLWDLKVSAAAPTSKQTLQLLIYYLLGQHAFEDELTILDEMGIFNPRLNTAWRVRADSIPAATIAEVSRNVIGYT
jgi:hypothetical protein